MNEVVAVRGLFDAQYGLIRAAVVNVSVADGATSLATALDVVLEALSTSLQSVTQVEGVTSDSVWSALGKLEVAAIRTVSKGASPGLSAALERLSEARSRASAEKLEQVA